MSRSGELPGVVEDRFWDGVRVAGEFFMGTAEVQKALEQLVRTLDALHIPYAIVGALALNEFGYQRTTVDVDVLSYGGRAFHFKQAMLGRGYAEKFAGSRDVTDTAHGVDIDVVLAGDYPGEGKPKPVVFRTRQRPRNAAHE